MNNDGVLQKNLPDQRPEGGLMRKKNNHDRALRFDPQCQPSSTVYRYFPMQCRSRRHPFEDEMLMYVCPWKLSTCRLSVRGMSLFVLFNQMSIDVDVYNIKQKRFISLHPLLLYKIDVGMRLCVSVHESRPKMRADNRYNVICGVYVVGDGVRMRAAKSEKRGESFVLLLHINMLVSRQ